MSPEKIEKLEVLVAVVVEGLKGLHEENIRLTSRIRELEKEKGAAVKENKQVRETLDKQKKLEASCRKMEKDRTAVRLKVQNVLQKIDEMDFV
ncbi:MAG: hypothetical protein IID18_05985 [Nitrospinae bacterium]|nr:hypothetical protein [Nitrospinota bacterium]